jgi:mannose/fructose/N-acetylgalactosamine-specific phosphotransferase system component IIC
MTKHSKTTLGTALAVALVCFVLGIVGITLSLVFAETDPNNGERNLANISTIILVVWYGLWILFSCIICIAGLCKYVKCGDYRLRLSSFGGFERNLLWVGKLD